MNLNVIKLKADAEEAKTLVVFATEGKSHPQANGVEKEISLLIKEAAGDDVLTGSKSDAQYFRNCYAGGFKHLLVIGLGDSKSADSETLRDAGARAFKALKSAKAKSAVIDTESMAKIVKPAADGVIAFTEGLLLSEYEFNDFKTAKKDAHELEISLNSGKSLTTAQLKNALETAKITSESVNFTRWLGDSPGNKMTPDILAKETQKAAKGTKLKVTVWDKARIKKEKMGGLLGVSLGSSEDPRFIIMEYKGAAASKKPLCFVGKGLTFDSGGISLKPGAGMHEMKYDMQGGATVIGAMLAIAKLKLKVNVVAYIPATENMGGAAACKPGDVLTARNGKTVEVLNTDAEGRLILMDALSYASEQKPAAIVDAATLTGAMVVALGNSHTGVYGNDDKLIKKIEKASETSNELVWHMPLMSHHHDDMKGLHADLSNLSSSRGAGSATAAAFLSNFVDKEIPWAHFDIAGTAWNCGNRLSYCPSKGATGSVVRTFIELAKQF